MPQIHLKSFRDHQWDLLQSNSGGTLPIQGPQEGSAAIFWPYFGILNNFPQFFRVNNSIEYWTLLNDYFLNEYSGFCFELNFELIIVKPEFSKRIAYP